LNLSISEQDVRAQITKAIDGLLAQHPLSRRRPDSVEIDQAGIHLKLALEAHVTGFNPKVTISGLIKLWAENGQPRYALVNYATSVSYSNPLGELVDWVASLFSESDVEGSIRKYLTAEIETFLATLERLINVTNSRLLSIEAASDEINYTICPKE
jgi:hypothetical protein